MTIRDFFRTLLGIRQLEERILMTITDATVRLESSLALLGTNVNEQLTAISLEIQQLASAVANGGDTSDIETRLNAAADKLDALRAQVTDSTAQLGSDDPTALPADGGGTDSGAGQTDPNAPTT